jgi:hypothetical protein
MLLHYDFRAFPIAFGMASGKSFLNEVRAYQGYFVCGIFQKSVEAEAKEVRGHFFSP